MMNQKKMIFGLILVLAAMMLSAVMLIVSQLPERPLMERLQFRDAATGQNLRPVYDKMSGNYILFLPAHVQPENIQLRLPGAVVRVSDDSREVRGSLASMPLDTELHLTARSLLGRETANLELQHCAGVQSLFLEAEAGTLAYLHEDKNHEKQALALLRDLDGQLVFSQVAVLSGRGNSSWDGQAKRPYELSFDSPVSFGSFDDISRLCLLAEFSDESKLHNAAAYHGAKTLGLAYATGYCYVNLFMNGEYLGLYGIATKDEYRKHLETDTIRAVFEITSNLEKQDFHPMLSRNPIRVLYGDPDEVMAAVDGFESALLSGEWAYCTDIIDPESFARKFVMEELFANSDMTYASQYFYLDGEGKIRCMLPWDYDLSLGYAFRYFNNKQVYEMESYKDPDGWYALLVRMPQFRQRALSVLEEHCTPVFASDMESFLLDTAGTIRPSWACDILRWRNVPAFNRFDLHCGEKTLEGMAQLYAAYIPQRVEYLKDHLENWENYCCVAFDGEQYGNLCIPRGAQLWDYLDGANILPGEKVRDSFQGWYTADGLTPEEITTVMEDVAFSACYG